jgi:signal transduction histidine kinase
MVYSYSEALLRSKDRSEWIDTLQVIQEAARRASSVAGNLKLFVELARDVPPTVRLKDVKLSSLFRKLRRAVKFLYTHKALGKHLEFELDESWSEDQRACLVDIDRLDLVLDNLLDNAVKYSFGETKVRISTDWPNHGIEACISFENQGLEITAQEADTLATRRGYRGTSAVLSHPEGTGIGLWMVGRVLKSMNGKLQIFPTDSVGMNTIRIYLKKAGEGQL